MSINKAVLFILLSFFFNGNFFARFYLSAEPWAAKDSKHPLTMDVEHGERKNFLFSPEHLFSPKKFPARSVYPFDMLFNFYTNHITVLNGVSCRYYPTCSDFAKTAIRRFGIIAGIVIGAERLLRCHEYQTDDLYDPVVLW